jgi:ubiquinone/menaquinone biosynthesis C-methylase UbiE
MQLIQDILSGCHGGDLLDAGCGPGVMVKALLKSRPDDFRITALDQSPGMIGYCASQVSDLGKVRLTVAKLESMPFEDASFDVVLVMGALEYTDASHAIREISRVTRQDGLVIVSMLNPLSAYRLSEWFLLWPAIRTLGAIERRFGLRSERPHEARRSGIHAYPAGMLRRRLQKADLQPVDTVYFDVTRTVPPIDRLPRSIRRLEHTPFERTMTRGWRRWMGSGYLVVAKQHKAGALAGGQPAR